jgi:hypothetical protein
MVTDAIAMKVREDDQQHQERTAGGKLALSRQKGGLHGHRDPEFLERARVQGG